MSSRRERLVGFPPSIDAACSSLVLGSAPSVRSLERVEYYGHPQNNFWPFMDELLGIPRGLPYHERCRMLRERGVALWDVVHRCRRELSADATIADVEANDFARLFRAYSALRAVFFNGSKAAELFAKLVRPTLGELAAAIEFHRLPSTSPANASQSRASKLAAWRVLCAV